MSPSRPKTILARVVYALVLLAILYFGQQRRALWRTQLNDVGIGGDALHYWHLAVHIDRDHSISLDGKQPSWTRLPGYPAFLALTTQPGISDTGPQDPPSIRARVYPWLDRLKRANLDVDLAVGALAAVLALALGAGGFSLLAAAWWAAQPWSSVISMHPLSDGLSTALTAAALAALAHATASRRARDFALAGMLAGLGQWVRGDAVLLVPAIALGALFAGFDWRSRLRFGGAALGAWVLVFAPWPARNLLVFGEPHFLGGGINIDKDGEPVERSAVFDWMRTWTTANEHETMRIAWRFPSQPLSIDDVPPQACDSPAERAALAGILWDYNRRGARLDPDLAARLGEISRARRERHPFDYWLRLPARRIADRLLPPRDGFGLGTLPTISTERETWNRADATVVIVGLLGLAAVSLRRRSRAVGLVLLGWLALRCVAITTIVPAAEPRYFLEILPLLAAAAAAFLPSLARLGTK